MRTRSLEGPANKKNVSSKRANKNSENSENSEKIEKIEKAPKPKKIKIVSLHSPEMIQEIREKMVYKTLTSKDLEPGLIFISRQTEVSWKLIEVDAEKDRVVLENLIPVGKRNPKHYKRHVGIHPLSKYYDIADY